MYDSLARLVRSLAADNGIRTLPRDQWRWPANVKLLNDEATRLPDDDVDTFVAGEFEALVGRYDLPNVNAWLEQVFDRDPVAGTYFVERPTQRNNRPNS